MEEIKRQLVEMRLMGTFGYTISAQELRTWLLSRTVQPSPVFEQAMRLDKEEK